MAQDIQRIHDKLYDIEKESRHVVKAALVHLSDAKNAGKEGVMFCDCLSRSRRDYPEDPEPVKLVKKTKHDPQEDIDLNVYIHVDEEAKDKTSENMRTTMMKLAATAQRNGGRSWVPKSVEIKFVPAEQALNFLRENGLIAAVSVNGNGAANAENSPIQITAEGESVLNALLRTSNNLPRNGQSHTQGGIRR